MMVLGRGQIFRPVLLACTYDNDTIIALQKKIDITDFPSERERERERERGGGGGGGRRSVPAFPRRHTSDVKTDTPYAWHYRVSSRTGWPGVSILRLGEKVPSVAIV